MMRELKNIGVFFICVMLLSVFIACSSDDEPEERLRPSLSTSTLSLKVGEKAVLHVSNVEKISSATTDAPNIISLKVEDSDIEVTALKEGDATIHVNVDGARLNCKVTVVASSTPICDFSGELQDERSRYVSPLLSMYYDTPGTIFLVEKNGTIDVRSLITGDYITFTPGMEKLEEGNLENASLQVNGNNIMLKSVILYRLTLDGSMWYHLVDEYGNNIVLVVTDL